MKLVMVAAAMSTFAFVSAGAQAQEALAQSSGCLTCHSVDAKKVGPAFKEISAKYKGKSDAQAQLVAKLKEGKGHPAVKASEADTKSLVSWILAM